MYKPKFEYYIEKNQKFAVCVEHCTEKQLNELYDVIKIRYNFHGTKNVSGICEVHDKTLLYLVCDNDPSSHLCTAKIMYGPMSMYFSFERIEKERDLTRLGFKILKIEDVLFPRYETVIERTTWTKTVLKVKRNDQVIKEIITKCENGNYSYEKEALKCHAVLQQFKTKYNIDDKVFISRNSKDKWVQEKIFDTLERNNYFYNFNAKEYMSDKGMIGTVYKIEIDYINKKVTYSVRVGDQFTFSGLEKDSLELTKL